MEKHLEESKVIGNSQQGVIKSASAQTICFPSVIGSVDRGEQRI